MSAIHDEIWAPSHYPPDRWFSSGSQADTVTAIESESTARTQLYKTKSLVLAELDRTTLCSLSFEYSKLICETLIMTRRPASADRTARRQFQATGQPVSRTQASDAMTSRLPRYKAKCVQHRCFQCGSVPLRSDIKGTELPPANILIPLERQLIALQLCRWEFLYNETLQQTFRPLLSKLSKRRQI